MILRKHVDGGSWQKRKYKPGWNVTLKTLFQHIYDWDWITPLFLQKEPLNDYEETRGLVDGGRGGNISRGRV